MSQILQENICARASFLIKLQAWNKQGELELKGDFLSILIKMA